MAMPTVEPATVQGGVLRKFSDHGDVVIRWKHDDAKSAERARQEFEGFRQQRYAFFGRRPHGRTTVQIQEFDPNLAEILVVPDLAGG